MLGATFQCICHVYLYFMYQPKKMVKSIQICNENGPLIFGLLLHAATMVGDMQPSQIYYSERYQWLTAVTHSTRADPKLYSMNHIFCSIQPISKKNIGIGS